MFGHIHFDDLMLTSSYESWKAYGQSKLANVLFTYELARRVQPNTSITVNCLHPGIVRTELSRCGHRLSRWEHAVHACVMPCNYWSWQGTALLCDGPDIVSEHCFVAAHFTHGNPCNLPWPADCAPVL